MGVALAISLAIPATSYFPLLLVLTPSIGRDRSERSTTSCRSG